MQREGRARTRVSIRGRWVLAMEAFIAAFVLAFLTAPTPLLGEAEAASNINAALVLHVASTVSKNPCKVTPPGACAEFVPIGPDSGEATVYVLVTNLAPSAGLAGVQFGIGYDARPGKGVDILDFQACGMNVIPGPSWPDSGSAVRLYGDPASRDCLGDATRLVGIFTVAVNGPDRLRLLPDPRDKMAKISDCALGELLLESVNLRPKPSPLGWVDFGGGTGYAPCGGKPEIEGSRWKAIGALHR